MEAQQLNWVANFIWGIADDVLRDLYVRGKYRDVILPMTVLRRLDAVLEPTKPAVLDMKASLDKAKITNQDQALRQAAGQAFYNTSRFTLRDLKARASQQQLRADFEAYLDGFSPNVQDILENFEFRNQIPRLSKADALGTLIEKLLSPDINLSPNPVLNGDGTVKHPGLDNHGMGTVFEELVRRFNEENNEEAGEHWTPRDAVKLMAKLIFLPIADEIESGTYLLYDGACGTGGMLTVAEEALQQLAQAHGKQVATHLYGQEINAETTHRAGAQRLVAVHRRRRPGREQHPPLDHRERLARRDRRAAAEHVLQHRHRHLHLGAGQPQARASQRQGAADVEHEQGGRGRATYGEAALEDLSQRLTAEFGRGFDASNLRNMRLFYQAFPIRDALRHELSWTHPTEDELLGEIIGSGTR